MDQKTLQIANLTRPSSKVDCFPKVKKLGDFYQIKWKKYKTINQRSWQVASIHICIKHPEFIKNFPKFIRPLIKRGISLYGGKNGI